LDYFCQTRLTKTLPHSDEQFFSSFGIANKHFNEFLRYSSQRAIPKASFYEFGAGWDLTVPLAYYAFGIERQTIVDIRSNVHFDLINDSISRFAKHNAKLESMTGHSLRPIDPLSGLGVKELEECLGITYLAPVDARNTGLSSESFDFISNTSTLEHIPEADLPILFAECRRLLRVDGVMGCAVDLRDHFCDADSRISPYHFLRYSTGAWARINSSLHFQNRLRYPDYLKLAAVSGLELVSHNTREPTPDDLAILRAMTLPSAFQMRYSLEEIGVKSLYMVLRRAEGNPQYPSKYGPTFSAPAL
jgi:SAM-dependent methyltransferase